MDEVRFDRAFRPLVVVFLIALFSSMAIAAVAWGSGVVPDARRASVPTAARPLAARIGVLQPHRISRAAISFRGGPITTSTGETVDVRVSDAFAVDAVTPEGWAEFLARMVHGPELSQLTMYVAPLAEVTELCGFGSLGCYSRNRSVAVGETLPDGTTPEDVVRHEYGHHIALYRANAPWRAIEWGPKHWASAAGVCARVARGEAYPGDQNDHYAQNPGEAWAETYRLMDERKAGIGTARWQIIAPSFYPTEAALQAAELDVRQPWTVGHRTVLRRALRKGQIWWIPLRTPLDGSLAVTVKLPRGGLHKAALMAADRKTVLKLGSSAGLRQRKIAATVCGQRSVYVRVTQLGAPGPVTVATSTP